MKKIIATSLVALILVVVVVVMGLGDAVTALAFLGFFYGPFILLFGALFLAWKKRSIAWLVVAIVLGLLSAWVVFIIQDNKYWSRQQTTTVPGQVDTTTPGEALKGALVLTQSPLVPFYLGVSIQGGIATVDFSEGARKYFNSPPGMQVTYFEIIKNVLKSEANVTKVEYSIDGKIVTDFDA